MEKWDRWKRSCGGWKKWGGIGVELGEGREVGGYMIGELLIILGRRGSVLWGGEIYIKE